MRALADLTYRARLQPAPPGWLDMGLAVPTMSTRRAREELGWTPRDSADDALLELLAGMARAGRRARRRRWSRTRAGASGSGEVRTGVGVAPLIPDPLSPIAVMNVARSARVI